MRTLEEYLEDNFNQRICDFSFRATKNQDGNGYVIVVHPSSVNGDTVDFEVKGNSLETLVDIPFEVDPA